MCTIVCNLIQTNINIKKQQISLWHYEAVRHPLTFSPHPLGHPYYPPPPTVNVLVGGVLLSRAAAIAPCARLHYPMHISALH